MDDVRGDFLGPPHGTTPARSIALERSVYFHRVGEGGGLIRFYRYLTSMCDSAVVHNIQLKFFGPHGEIKESSRTNKYIMITNMMNQKRGLTDSINCSAEKENSWRQITSLSICSKRKTPADRIWVKQQTRISIRNTHRKLPSKTRESYVFFEHMLC